MRLLLFALFSTLLTAADPATPQVPASGGPVNIVVNPATDRILPQLVDGDGWKTSFFLTNMEPSKTIFWRVQFFLDNGLPAAFPIEGAGPASFLFASLPPGASVTFETTGTSTTLLQGWARVLTYDRSSDQQGAQLVNDRIGGMAIFRQRIAGRPDFEAVVPLSPSNETRFILPFDNRANFSTGVAILNPDSNSTAAVEVMLKTIEGMLIRQDSFVLLPGAKQVFSMPTRYLESAGRHGRMEVTTMAGSLSVLGLRFNPTGAFTSTHALSNTP